VSWVALDEWPLCRRVVVLGPLVVIADMLIGGKRSLDLLLPKRNWFQHCIGIRPPVYKRNRRNIPGCISTTYDNNNSHSNNITVVLIIVIVIKIVIIVEFVVLAVIELCVCFRLRFLHRLDPLLERGGGGSAENNNETAESDVYTHFSTFALSGNDGSVRWHHLPGDFEQKTASRVRRRRTLFVS